MCIKVIPRTKCGCLKPEKTISTCSRKTSEGYPPSDKFQFWEPGQLRQDREQHEWLIIMQDLDEPFRCSPDCCFDQLQVYSQRYATARDSLRLSLAAHSLNAALVLLVPLPGPMDPLLAEYLRDERWAAPQRETLVHTGCGRRRNDWTARDDSASGS